jgi:hypothetical protein
VSVREHYLPKEQKLGVKDELRNSSATMNLPCLDQLTLGISHLLGFLERGFDSLRASVREVIHVD